MNQRTPILSDTSDRPWAEALRRALLRHSLQSLKQQYLQRHYRAVGRGQLLLRVDRA